MNQLNPPGDEVTGPYDPATFGSCGCHGQPLNRYGRCQPLNISEWPTLQPAQPVQPTKEGTTTP